MSDSIKVLIITYAKSTRLMAHGVHLSDQLGGKSAALYISVDGEVSDSEKAILEDQICEYYGSDAGQTREIIIRFVGEQLGSRLHCRAAIDWFFSQEISGFIIEDDVFLHEGAFLLPQLEGSKSQTFAACFYGNDTGQPVSSCIFSPWGWFSTRDAWRHFRAHDAALTNLDNGRLVKKIFKIKELSIWQRFFFSGLLLKNRRKATPHWDQALQDHIFCSGQVLLFFPNCVQNKGFDAVATNTTKRPITYIDHINDNNHLLFYSELDENISDRSEYLAWIIWRFPRTVSDLLYVLWSRLGQQ